MGPTTEPTPQAEHWFEPLAEYLGAAYLRYSFTKGTVSEVDAVIEALGLTPGMRVLDVGCGPGRHARELARRGIATHGIDISARFIELATADAPEGATFERLDARHLPFDGEFDAVICLCQGAFGLMTAAGDDELVLRSIARALPAGGRLALSAFNAYFSVKYQDDADFDADRGIAHEHTELRNEQGDVRAAELWTACYTPRELRLLARACGLRVDAVWGVMPGDYRALAPSTLTPEHLLIATKNGS